MKQYSLTFDGITQSLMGQYMACPKRFQFAIQGWSQKESFAITMGSFGHWVLSLLREGKKVNPDLYSFPKWRTAEEKEFIKAAVLTVCTAYMKLVWPSIYSKKSKVLAEQVFKFPFENTFLKGKTDGMILSGKKLIMLETKFKSRIPEDTLEIALQNDWQVLFYSLVNSPHEVIYDIIRYPQFSKIKPSDLVDKINTDIKRDAEHWFKPKIITIDKESVFNFGLELKSKICELFNRKIFWRNQCACTGMYTCPYLRLCFTGTDSELIKKPLFSELLC